MSGVCTVYCLFYWYLRDLGYFEGKYCTNGKGKFSRRWKSVGQVMSEVQGRGGGNSGRKQSITSNLEQLDFGNPSVSLTGRGTHVTLIRETMALVALYKLSCTACLDFS